MMHICSQCKPQSRHNTFPLMYATVKHAWRKQTSLKFPALTPFENTLQRTKHSWKIQASTVMSSAGATNQTTAVEATLNWQSENAVAQNNVLKTILAQQDSFTKTQEELVSRMQGLENIIYEV
ncbi:hypothetical protein L1987_87955 [Smallanthus sonchifolius]|nr:hypothetical protein L1987_87955 [Smallanthus sonchifolius]